MVSSARAMRHVASPPPDPPLLDRRSRRHPRRRALRGRRPPQQRHHRGHLRRRQHLADAGRLPIHKERDVLAPDALRHERADDALRLPRVRPHLTRAVPQVLIVGRMVGADPPRALSTFAAVGVGRETRSCDTAPAAPRPRCVSMVDGNHSCETGHGPITRTEILSTYHLAPTVP